MLLRAEQVRPRFAIDWDGTFVTDSWPAMGDWMPGAIEALREMLTFADVVVHTCRIAPVEFRTDDVPRDPVLVQQEKQGIRTMLDREGFHEVQIWDKPWKPPADAYIDNKGIHYNGRKGAWKALTERLALQYA